MKENKIMEWKFKVGDVVSDGIHEYEVTELGSRGYFVHFKKSSFVSKGLLESCTLLLKPKSLYEQALELLNLKIGDEFEFNMFTKGNHWVAFRVLEDGFESLCDFGSLCYHVDLDSLLKNPNNIRNIITLKPKSEVELDLDELKVLVDKANEILRKGGW